MNTANISLASTVLAAALGLALGLSATPAGADCPHRGNENHKHCDGGGGGGGDPGDVATNDTRVKWTGSELSEMDDRSCFFGFAIRDGKNGSYGCALYYADVVTFNLVDGVELDRKGKVVSVPSGICDAFSNGLMMAPNYTYESDWNGFCMSDGGCDVRVLNGFYDTTDDPSLAETGLIKLEAFGHVSNTSNPNPFADLLHIGIAEVLITVKGDGTDKTVAICQYDSPDAIFDSTPVL